MRSGQQAALAGDLIAMIEALGLDRPVVAGYDWGGRGRQNPLPGRRVITDLAG
ncbi:alpha/beta fold hydrolase [Streptomyces sp. GMR22]|uniref:alpha/beta fold hydrolase n=1 Tax=Streptomyces sp. GMR22 TaxID=2759524 RepID=UPI0018EF6787|nr:hypothetical protein [Streptomyces sp. GMR22]